MDTVTYAYTSISSKEALVFSEVREQIEQMALQIFPVKAAEAGVTLTGEPCLTWGAWLKFDEEWRAVETAEEDATHRMLYVEAPGQKNGES